MANDGISVPCHRDLKPLAELLSGVRRAGDFFGQGSPETPMPRVEGEGVGLISFPVSEAQIQQLIQRQCEQHRADCASMNALLDVMQPVPKELLKLAARLTAAKERKPQT